jgi:hypothetical protein
MVLPDLLKISLFLGVPSGSSVQILLPLEESTRSEGAAIIFTSMVLYGGGKVSKDLAGEAHVVVNRLG